MRAHGLVANWGSAKDWGSEQGLFKVRATARLPHPTSARGIRRDRPRREHEFKIVKRPSPRSGLRTRR